jgi:hypothetical protein
MAYNKDSGESRLQKDASPNNYIQKKNRNIFRNSQTAQPPPKPQPKTNYDRGIPDMDVPYTEFEPDKRETPRYENKEYQHSYGSERWGSNKSESEQELLSFGEIIGIIVANGLVPIIGGFIFYIIFSSRGKKQQAVQSIVLSAIVSIIRIMYIIN